MATFNKFRQFVEDLLKGVHNFTSDSTCTLKVALTSVAPVNTNEVLASLTEISYTNFSTRIITGATAEQAAGIATLTADDLVLTASNTTPSFRYIVLYNDDPVSPAKPLIGWYDYGSDIVLQAGETLTIDFSTGALTIQ